jgi:endonuclease YncB( thermonuclease family)
MSFLTRPGERVHEGVVEYVFNGGRFKVHIPKENVVVAVSLIGVATPRTARPARANQPAEPAEDCADEAFKFVKRAVMNNNVTIDIEVRWCTRVRARVLAWGLPEALVSQPVCIGFLRGWRSSGAALARQSFWSLSLLDVCSFGVGLSINSCGLECAHTHSSACCCAAMMISQDADDRGVALATVFVKLDGKRTNLNLELVKRGYARVAKFSADKTRLRTQLYDAMDAARDNRIGMWKNFTPKPRGGGGGASHCNI